MKIEALNCPNCGAGALSDSTRCDFCESRLKTMACSACLGLMFICSRHCSHCGAKVIPVEESKKERSGDCPRCKIELNLLQIEEISLLECQKCSGLWSDSETFEEICAEKESQAKVLFLVQSKQTPKPNIPINYVPCPDCKQLMYRSNFSRSSGVILDICKNHGVWFDAEELTKIIEFIHNGGLDYARRKEIQQLQEDRRELEDKKRQISLENRRFQQTSINWDKSYSLSIRGFIRGLFD
jgi:Zn-finger nucleic acid-binding protein